ncbi:50S ribosomal protein L18 [Candidatus Saccharibacteria bacterium]|nr:50S ribosomal protein L18 [Candidatus Saccharibacteria bacterium]
MNRLNHKMANLAQRKRRIRKLVSGTSQRPRLSVFVSNHHVVAQIIDDTSHITLAYASTVSQKTLSGTMTERAAAIGAQIADKAKAAKIKQVVLDRNGKLYHGRVKALADAARQAGLEF